MQLWLNGRKPPYMDSIEAESLTLDHITHAVNSMTHGALQMCAAGYLLAMQKLGWTPREISAALESLEEIENENSRKVG